MARKKGKTASKLPARGKLQQYHEDESESETPLKRRRNFNALSKALDQKAKRIDSDDEDEDKDKGDEEYEEEEEGEDEERKDEERKDEEREDEEGEDEEDGKYDEDEKKKIMTKLLWKPPKQTRGARPRFFGAAGSNATGRPKVKLGDAGDGSNSLDEVEKLEELSLKHLINLGDRGHSNAPQTAGQQEQDPKATPPPKSARFDLQIYGNLNTAEPKVPSNQREQTVSDPIDPIDPTATATFPEAQTPQIATVDESVPQPSAAATARWTTNGLISRAGALFSFMTSAATSPLGESASEPRYPSESAAPSPEAPANLHLKRAAEASDSPTEREKKARKLQPATGQNLQCSDSSQSFGGPGGTPAPDPSAAAAGTSSSLSVTLKHVGTMTESLSDSQLSQAETITKEMRKLTKALQEDRTNILAEDILSQFWSRLQVPLFLLKNETSSDRYERLETLIQDTGFELKASILASNETKCESIDILTANFEKYNRDRQQALAPSAANDAGQQPSPEVNNSSVARAIALANAFDLTKSI